MPRLRIAIVLQTPADAHSAVLIGYRALSRELERLGHIVTIVSPDTFPAMRRLGGRLAPLSYPVAIAGWTRRHRGNFDLFVFHSYAGWLAQRLAIVGPAAVAVAFHGLEPLYHQRLRSATARRGGRLSLRYRILQEHVMPRFLRTACRRADLVTCLNGAEREFLVAAGWAPPDRIVTLAHGAPEVFFAPPRQPRAIEELVFVGQWLGMKGVADLRDAFATLARRYPALRLTCAGTLVDAAAVLADFPDDVRPRVRGFPRGDQPALAALYRSADVFVFPSHYEGFSRAIVEAMASGLPIVTTGVGVALDALEDGRSAIVVPRADPQAIVDAVDALIRDPALAAGIALQARAAAERYHEPVCNRASADVLVDAALNRRPDRHPGAAVA